MSHAARRRLTGSVLAGIAIVVAMVFLASLGTHSNPVISAARADEAEQVQPSDAARAAALLARLGVSPESLAAVGAAPQEAAAIVLLADAYFLSYPDELQSADQALGAARAEESRLMRLIQSGEGTEQDVSALGAARAAVTQTESNVALALGIAKAQVLSGLSEGQKLGIERIRQNRTIYGDAMPVAVAADVWTDAEWINARAGLTSVEQAESYGVAPDSGAEDVAKATMDRVPVAAAADNMADLAQVKAAWDSALAGL